MLWSDEKAHEIKQPENGENIVFITQTVYVLNTILQGAKIKQSTLPGFCYY